MKTIVSQGLQPMTGFNEFAVHDQFIYQYSSGEFFAMKISDEYAAFVNGEGKWILAQRYANCLSIGSGVVHEYASFDEAEQSAAACPIL